MAKSRDIRSLLTTRTQTRRALEKELRALAEPGVGARPEPGTAHDGEGAPSFRPPLNLAAPSLPPRRGQACIALADAALLPVDDF